MSRIQSTAGLQLLGDGGSIGKIGRLGRIGRRRSIRKIPEHPNAGSGCAASGSFARGVLEAAWITAIFVALGLAYAEVLNGPLQGRPCTLQPS